MRKILSRVVNAIGDDPTRAMTTFVGFLFMANGLYVASPWYVQVGHSPLFDFAYNPEFQFLIGSIYFLLGSVALISTMLNDTLKHRRLATMSIFLASLFAVLFRLSTLGWHPSGWVFSLMLTGIFACVWLHVNKCYTPK